jgi:hypothetical protein
MNGAPADAITDFQVTALINYISVDRVVWRIINWILDESLAALVGVGVCRDLWAEQRRAQRLGGEVAAFGRFAGRLHG